MQVRVQSAMPDWVLKGFQERLSAARTVAAMATRDPQLAHFYQQHRCLCEVQQLKQHGIFLRVQGLSTQAGLTYQGLQASLPVPVE